MCWFKVSAELRAHLVSPAVRPPAVELESFQSNFIHESSLSVSIDQFHTSTVPVSQNAQFLPRYDITS